MKTKNFILLIIISCILKPILANNGNQFNKKALLGQRLFFDTILSENRTQSCSQCHNPSHGFIDNRDNGVKSMASIGDDEISLGDRNAPTLTYSSFAPKLHLNKNQWIGGYFYDGRASDLEAQAGKSPLNPIEMGMDNISLVIKRLKEDKSYNDEFLSIYGESVFINDETAYDAMKNSIAEFERTNQFSTFDSKYDRYLNGEYELTVLEDLGRSLFFSNNNINCSSCHQLNLYEDSKEETFSNYEYHNIGIPVNFFLRKSNGLGLVKFDHGLLSNNFISDKKHDGKIKVPTLRNVSITGPYMHNGIFQNLSTVIKFYDKYVNSAQIINPETGKLWGKPEIPETVNLIELRKGQKLTERKIDALIAFINILTDKRYEYLIPKEN